MISVDFFLHHMQQTNIIAQASNLGGRVLNAREDSLRQAS